MVVLVEQIEDEGEEFDGEGEERGRRFRSDGQKR